MATGKSNNTNLMHTALGFARFTHLKFEVNDYSGVLYFLDCD